MSVQSHRTASADNRMLLVQVLADLRVYGEVIGFADEAGLHRYTYALGGYRKVRRVQALAPDIAAGMGALTASITRLEDDALVEIALLTRPFVSMLELRKQPAVAHS